MILHELLEILPEDCRISAVFTRNVVTDDSGGNHAFHYKEFTAYQYIPLYKESPGLPVDSKPIHEFTIKELRESYNAPINGVTAIDVLAATIGPGSKKHPTIWKSIQVDRVFPVITTTKHGGMIPTLVIYCSIHQDKIYAYLAELQKTVNEGQSQNA